MTHGARPLAQRVCILPPRHTDQTPADTRNEIFAHQNCSRGTFLNTFMGLQRKMCQGTCTTRLRYSWQPPQKGFQSSFLIIYPGYRPTWGHHSHTLRARGGNGFSAPKLPSQASGVVCASACAIANTVGKRNLSARFERKRLQQKTWFHLLFLYLPYDIRPTSYICPTSCPPERDTSHFWSS